MSALRVLRWSTEAGPREIPIDEISVATLDAWTWVDADASDPEGLVALGEELGLDRLAMAGAVDDDDISKLDDFGEQLLIVLHGLSEESNDEVKTYELDMFLTKTTLITVRSSPSRTIDHLWEEIQQNADFVGVSPDVVAAGIASIIMRRWATLVNCFDEQLDELIERALAADRDVLRDVTFLRSELSTIRTVLRPQLETLAELRTSPSVVLGPRSHHRFSDAFDTSTRIDHSIESVRSELLTALDAYRGAEARSATEISRVLTIYAAILLPLSFVVGFFGMNVPNIPGANSPNAWKWIVAAMVVMTIGSLAIFARSGWITMPRGRRPTGILRKALDRAKHPLDQRHSMNMSMDPPTSQRRSSPG